MAKVTVVLCDVKPCTHQADREFEVNGQTLYVCGEQCFTRFWSREYGTWKESRYRLQISFHQLTLMPKSGPQEVFEKSSIEFRSDLQMTRLR